MSQNNLIYAEKHSSQSLFRTDWHSISTFWRLLIIVCLVAGIVFRFANLEGKVFQYDEAISMLRVAGYTEPEAVQQLANANLIYTADLQKYQKPDSAKGVEDTVKGLALEEAQLTPLYFVLLRFWTESFGTSIAIIRMLSVAGSILTLPCMYWLCLELFESALAGWLGVAILAVSPFQLLYAQEARPNSLWAATILLSSAALFRAMRVQTKVSWLLYFVAATASLYTYLFSGFVAIAHVLYVLELSDFDLLGEWLCLRSH